MSVIKNQGNYFNNYSNNKKLYNSFDVGKLHNQPLFRSSEAIMKKSNIKTLPKNIKSESVVLPRKPKKKKVTIIDKPIIINVESWRLYNYENTAEIDIEDLIIKSKFAKWNNSISEEDEEEEYENNEEKGYKRKLSSDSLIRDLMKEDFGKKVSDSQTERLSLRNRLSKSNKNEGNNNNSLSKNIELNSNTSYCSKQKNNKRSMSESESHSNNNYNSEEKCGCFCIIF